MKITASLLFRNNSTGNPTKIHIINENGDGSFCGYDDFCAQVYSSDNEEWLEIEFCKKCLKSHRKQQNENLIDIFDLSNQPNLIEKIIK